MREPIFERLLVVGLGLLGGSVALGAHERGLAREIRGVDPKAPEGCPFPLVGLEEGAAWADAVVLAVPVEQVEGVLKAMAPALGPETLLTDTVSVKEVVADAAHRLLTNPQNCVGAHPMAGGDQGGFENARPDLFEAAPCILTPAGTEPRQIVDRVEEFWQGLGTFTVRQTPAEHDRCAAKLSHASHVVAFAYAGGLPGEEILRLAGPGLRDFLRIARGDPALWVEILLRNRGHIAEEIARFQKGLDGLMKALGNGDREALEQTLRSAQTAVEKMER